MTVANENMTDLHMAALISRWQRGLTVRRDMCFRTKMLFLDFAKSVKINALELSLYMGVFVNMSKNKNTDIYTDRKKIRRL
jgi:hypothetical protein